MTPSIIIAVVLGGLLIVVALWVIAVYNSLVGKRVDADNGWAQIDVQLKRRYDLIPNLVETVKGYASHEKGTLEAVISARSRAVDVSNSSVAQRAEAENMLGQALGRLIALSEAYPDLKANSNFAALQEELASTENKIGFSRQHYNDCVARYEQARQMFPGSVVAGAFNFAKRDYFEVQDSGQREAPKVKFGA
ncbi:MAG: LemA family protein [Phycisphaeraceae bacterium]|nr:LemA family protein [Phycisphaeraceae bacterium]